jgi:spermidine/putrescine transport system substrate-binding protein
MTERNPELDRLIRMEIQRRRITRRRVLGRMGIGMGALAIGPSVLAACGDDDDDDEASTGDGDRTTVARTESDTLRVSNWPGYVDPGEEGTTPTVELFQTASGLTVEYSEDVNDNEEYFAGIREQLDRNQDIGADLFVVTDFLVSRLIGLGWIAEFDPANVPNKSNLVDNLQGVDFDPDRVLSLPYFSGFTGLAYNLEQTGREITGVDDLFDSEFAGKVTLFSDLRDGLGMLISAERGGDLDEVTQENIDAAVERVAQAKADGQIRRFTGNDYLNDLTSGNIAIAQAYSGDVAQVTTDDPNIRFILPEGGGLLWSDNMTIPKTTKNLTGAEKFMDWIYDPVNNAALTAYVQFISPVKGVAEELEKIDPALVENPLINPPDEYVALAHVFPTLNEDQEVPWTEQYNEVTAG